MAVVNVDWDSMESNSFEPLEAGEYTGKITKATMSSKVGPSGYHYIEVEITLDDENRRCWSNYSLSPKAMWRLKQDFGEDGLNVDGVESGTFDTDDFVGLDVVVELGVQDKYNGKPDENGVMPQENNVEALRPGGF
jgi:hypothetical protein